MAQTADAGGNTLILGGGRLYVAELRDGGQGELRYLGASPGASLSIEQQRLTVMDPDGPDPAAKLADIVTDTTRTLSMTLNDISAGNIALFLSGATDEAGANEVTELISPAVRDAWYQLGTGRKADGTALDIAGPILRVGSVKEALKGATAVDKVAYGSDGRKEKYVVDEAHGRVKVVGDTGAGALIHGDPAAFRLVYTPVAGHAVAAASREIKVALRYQESRPMRGGIGKARHLYSDCVSIRPGGEWALKSEGQVQQLPLVAEVLGGLWVYAEGE